MSTKAKANKSYQLKFHENLNKRVFNMYKFSHHFSHHQSAYFINTKRSLSLRINV